MLFTNDGISQEIKQLVAEVQLRGQYNANLLHSIASFLVAFSSLQWDDFRYWFAEEATVFFPRLDNPIRVEGQQAIEASFAHVFKEAASPLDLRPHDLQIQEFCDVAIVTFHLFDPGTLCRRTLIWHQGIDGWKILHLHASNLSFVLVPSS